jgi:hypothetical protein
MQNGPAAAKEQDMVFESSSPRLMLATGELLRLPAGACATLVCASGSVWVTRDGDAGDVVLSGGESLDFKGSALTLVQAFEPSLVQVRAASAPCADDAAEGRWTRVGRRTAALTSGARAWLRPTPRAAATSAGAGCPA